jgi:hypothetical protein
VSRRKEGRCAIILKICGTPQQARACTVFACACKTIEETGSFRSGLTRLRPGANFKLKKRRAESTRLRLLLQDVKEMIEAGLI